MPYGKCLLALEMKKRTHKAAKAIWPEIEQFPWEPSEHLTPLPSIPQHALPRIWMAILQVFLLPFKEMMWRHQTISSNSMLQLYDNRSMVTLKILSLYAYFIWISLLANKFLSSLVTSFYTLPEIVWGRYWSSEWGTLLFPSFSKYSSRVKHNPSVPLWQSTLLLITNLDMSKLHKIFIVLRSFGGTLK